MLRLQLQTRIPRTQLVDNGSYAEYIVTVMLDGNEWTVHKRYREFDGALLRWQQLASLRETTAAAGRRSSLRGVRVCACGGAQSCRARW